MYISPHLDIFMDHENDTYGKISIGDRGTARDKAGEIVGVSGVYLYL